MPRVEEVTIKIKVEIEDGFARLYVANQLLPYIKDAEFDGFKILD